MGPETSYNVFRAHGSRVYYEFEGYAVEGTGAVV